MRKPRREPARIPTFSASDSPVSPRSGGRGAAGRHQPSPADTHRPLTGRETQGTRPFHLPLGAHFPPTPRAQVLWPWQGPGWQAGALLQYRGHLHSTPAATQPAWIGQVLLRGPSLPGISAEYQSPDTHVWAMSLFHAFFLFCSITWTGPLSQADSNVSFTLNLSLIQLKMLDETKIQGLRRFLT